MEEEAAEIEQMLAAPPTRPPRAIAASPSQPRQRDRYEIDCILEVVRTQGKAKTWVLVRWAGYEPDWERWRIQGAVGTALETWEPISVVWRTEAWAAWCALQEEEEEEPRLH